MTKLGDTLRSLDPARQMILRPTDVDSLWADIQERMDEPVSTPRASTAKPFSSSAGARLRYASLFGSAIAVAALIAVGAWVGLAGHTGSSTQSALVHSLRGARLVSAPSHARSHGRIPTEHYTYGAGTDLSQVATQLPVYPVDTTVTGDQLTSLIAATGVPTGGSWSTDAASAYSTDPAQTYTLTVTQSGGLPAFAYVSNTSSCTTAASGEPVGFDPATAASWSDAFLSALGYSPSTFSAPTDDQSGVCDTGPYWSFYRIMQINGAPTGTVFSFSYSPTDGTLLTASGAIVALGDGVSANVSSPWSAAQSLAQQDNAAGPGDSKLHHVTVTLATGSVAYGLYQLSSGTLEYVPIYEFTATCSANKVYCESTTFAGTAIAPTS